jgi:hypothetical protein
MVLKASVSPRSSFLAPRGQGRRSRASLCFRALPRHFFFFLILLLGCLPAFAAQVTIDLQTNGAGTTLTGSKAAGYTMDWSATNINGLGIGSAPAGAFLALPYGTDAAANKGAVYESSYNIVISGLPGPHLTTIKAFVLTNFGTPNALRAEDCTTAASCGAVATSYTPTSLAQATASTIQTITGNGTVTANVGVLVALLSGAGFSNGAGQVTIRLIAQDTFNANTDTVDLTIKLKTVTGLRFVLATAAAAPNCAVADPGTGADYSLSLGNVTGLGVAAGGCSTPIAGNPAIYYTNYKETASFSGFANGSATLSLAVTTNFVKPYITMREAATVAGIAAGTLPASFTVTAATNGITQTRVVGVAITPSSGTAVSAGADSAIITYTLTP